MALLTKVQRERKEKYQKVRKLYTKLSANPENSTMAIEEVIMEKLGIGSRSTVWYIVNGYTNSYGANFQEKSKLEGNLNPPIGSAI